MKSKQKFYYRLAKEKKITKRNENIECTFKPEINKAQIDYAVTSKFDKCTKKYFQRQKHAQQERDNFEKFKPEIGKEHY
jgi:hypothetical protein